jgi:hypothetical protein
MFRAVFTSYNPEMGSLAWERVVLGERCSGRIGIGRRLCFALYEAAFWDCQRVWHCQLRQRQSFHLLTALGRERLYS